MRLKSPNIRDCEACAGALPYLEDRGCVAVDATSAVWHVKPQADGEEHQRDRVQGAAFQKRQSEEDGVEQYGSTRSGRSS